MIYQKYLQFTKDVYKMIDDQPYPCSFCNKTVIENKIAQTVIHCYDNAVICGQCIIDLAKYNSDPRVLELEKMLGGQLAIFVDGDNISEYLKPDSKLC